MRLGAVDGAGVGSFSRGILDDILTLLSAHLTLQIELPKAFSFGRAVSHSKDPVDSCKRSPLAR